MVWLRATSDDVSQINFDKRLKKLSYALLPVFPGLSHWKQARPDATVTDHWKGNGTFQAGQ